MLHSEFRDGNVPAGFEQLQVLRESLDKAAALGVEKVSLRSDSAGYQKELLLYCGEGEDARFGVIDFAVSADVTGAFKAAASEVREADWHPLTRRDADGRQIATGQEWAEVCYVPNWARHGRGLADYRFLAIREPLGELPLGDCAFRRKAATDSDLKRPLIPIQRETRRCCPSLSPSSRRGVATNCSGW